MTRPKSLINGLPLHIPPSLSGVAPVSPDKLDFPYEIHAWLGLNAVLEPNSIAYDCGAAHGLMSAMMAQRIVGGEIHAFEANPRVLPIMAEVLETNEATATVNACCVGERSGLEVEFYCAPGLSCVASGRHLAVKAAHSEAEVVRVPVIALDDYASERSHQPDVIKLDIEGSEWVALEGAVRILGSAPHLVIETHPRQMTGDGASLEGLCRRLEEIGYPLFDLRASELINGTAFAGKYHQLPGYLLASTRLKDAGFLRELQDQHASATARYSWRERYSRLITEMRRLLDVDASEAVRIGEGILAEMPAHGEANYLVGLGLQLLDRDWKRAVQHYEKALECGFDAYWVNYNLDALLKSKKPSG